MNVKLGFCESTRKPIIVCKYEHGDSIESSVMRLMLHLLEMGHVFKIAGEAKQAPSFQTSFELNLSDVLIAAAKEREAAMENPQALIYSYADIHSLIQYAWEHIDMFKAEPQKIVDHWHAKHWKK